MNVVQVLEHSNLLEVKSGIICQQVNCVGVMGAGLALQIKRKWPVVYKNYKQDCDLVADDPTKLMGCVQDTLVGDGLVVANCFGQVYPGMNRVMTDYFAWDMILDKLCVLANFFSLDLHFPWGIGCGLAGGDWGIISEKLHNKFNDSKTLAFIHKL